MVVWTIVVDPDSLNPDSDTDRIQHFKWIRIQGFDNQKFKKKKIQLKIIKFFYIFFWSKIAIYLSLGLYKGRPSIQPSKENIQ
jgi:hypothetical protein